MSEVTAMPGSQPTYPPLAPGPAGLLQPGPPPGWPVPAPPQRVGAGMVGAAIAGVVLVAAFVVAIVIVVGAGVHRVQGKEHPAESAGPQPYAQPLPSPYPSLPALPDPDQAGMWTVGSCVAHDPNKQDGGYQEVDCSDPDAVATVTDLPPSPPAGDEPSCPSGTDDVVYLTRAYDGFDTGVPVGSACLRFLTAPHPGDPGAGGGQLVVGDCIAAPGSDYVHVKEIPCAQGGENVLALLPVGGSCPAGSADRFEMVAPNSRYGVICTRQ